MDLQLCVLSTILFSTAFQILIDNTSFILTSQGYSSAQISLVILSRVVGKILIGFFFRNIIRRAGVFRSVVGAIIIFCEAVCISYFVESINIVIVVALISSIIFNFVILHMNSTIRNHGNAQFLVTYYSISQILSALFIQFKIIERIIVIISIGLVSLGCFLFRDLNKSQLDTNEKGEGAILKAYFKYGKYFWSSLLYSISNWLINKYLLLSLIPHMDNIQIAKTLFFLPLGRLCLNYLVSKSMNKLSPQNKIIISSIWTIASVATLSYTMHSRDLLFLSCVFFSGVFVNSKVFIMEYFTKVRQPEDYNMSLQLTEQQIDSLSQFLVIMIGSVLSFWNATYWIFTSLVAFHIIVIFTLIF